MKKNMMKRMCSFVLCLCMISNLFTGLTVDVTATETEVGIETEVAEETTTEETTTEETESSTTGTTTETENAVETIEIGTPEEFIELTKADFTALSNDIILLTADIDMIGESAIVPIGGSETFQGVFDGQGHVIKNLTIINTGNCTGLFGYVGTEGQITRLGLQYITVSGNTNTGAFAGCLTGSVTECYVTGNISGARYTGGIAGMLHAGTIENCWVDVAFKGTRYCGALFGGSDYNTRYTTDASYSPVAGVIEDKAMVIRNNLTMGTVSARRYAAGLIGDMGYSSASALEAFEGNVAWTESVSVSENDASDFYDSVYAWWSPSRPNPEILADNVYWDEMVLTGADPSATSTSCASYETLHVVSKTAEELGNVETYVNLGWDFENTWVWNENLGHPVLKNVAAPAINVVNTIEIGTVEEFLAICDARRFEDLTNDNIILTADIDMTGEAAIEPICGSRAFNGTFDGQGHVIKNLMITGTANCTGLIGYVGTEGQIKNLGLDGVTVKGDINTGALAGTLSGSITACYVTGWITGMRYTGGIAGQLHAGTIENCWIHAQIKGSRYCGMLFGGTDYNTRGSGSPIGKINTEKPIIVRNNLTLGTLTANRYAAGILGEMGDDASGLLEVFEGNVAWTKSITTLGNDALDYYGPVYAHWDAAKAPVVNADNLYWAEMVITGVDTSATQVELYDSLRIKAETNLKIQETYENLNWDFENTWVWSSDLEHPVLNGFSEPSYVPGIQRTPASVVTTYADSPKTTRAFTWYTDTTITDTIVQAVPQEMYASEADFSGEYAIKEIGTVYALETAADGTSRNIHKVQLTGLEAGKSYVYRVGDGKYWSPVYTFETEPEDAESFTFFNMTDTQDQYVNYANTLKYATTAYPEAAFIVHSGDVIQENATGDYDELYRVTSKYLTDLPSMVTPGNHELAKDVSNGNFEPDYVKGLDNYISHYQFPGNGPEGGDQIIYSFDYGDAHFVILNSNISGYVSEEIQIEWLEQDLAASDKAWKIVSIHHGPFNSGGKGSSAMIQAMADLDVDLVLFGHNHVYMRSNPIAVSEDGVITVGTSVQDENGVYYADSEGTTYHSSGCAGGVAGSLTSSQYFAVYNNTSKDSLYSAITVTEDALTIKTHSVPNKYPANETMLLDTYVIEKPAAECTAPISLALTYNGQVQALVEAGITEDGIMQYSLDGETYSETIPTATDAGTYTVWYKVAGDKDHSDSEAQSVTVTIETKDIADAIIILGDSLTYNGIEQAQMIESVEIEGIPVTYEVSGNKGTNAGDDYILTITGTGNFKGTAAKVWSIAKAEVTFTEPEVQRLVYNGQAQALVVAGTSENGTMQYSLDGETYSAEIPKAVDVASYTVWYKIKADANYKDSEAYSITVDIEPKNIAGVTIVLGEPLTYNGTEQTQTVESVIVDGLSATFEVTGNTGTESGDDYIMTITGTGNFYGSINQKWSIDKAEGTYTAPAAKALTYTGQAQELIDAGTAKHGTMLYSLDGKCYSAEIPKAVDAGTYTIWYKVKGDANHSDSTEQSITAVIEQKDIETAVITLGDTIAYNGSEQTQEVVSVEVDGLAVTYEVTGNTGMEVSDTYVLTVIGTGNFKGTATATWSIVKGKPSYTAPVAKKLYFNGRKQELIEAGVTEHGTMFYSLDGENYSSEIPKAIFVGTYTVWYKVEGDENYEDSIPQSIAVTIELNLEYLKGNGLYYKPLLLRLIQKYSGNQKIEKFLQSYCSIKD